MEKRYPTTYSIISLFFLSHIIYLYFLLLLIPNSNRVSDDFPSISQGSKWMPSKRECL